MLAGAVGGDVAGGGGVGDERAAAGEPHRPEAARHRRRALAPALRVSIDEGIVAAGVEDGDGHLGPPLHLGDDLLDIDGAVAERPLALDRHVGRQQEVLAADLDAVAGEEEERDLGAVDRRG